jgi:hypothetical protein
MSEPASQSVTPDFDNLTTFKPKPKRNRRILTWTTIGVMLTGLCAWSVITLAATESPNDDSDQGSGCNPSGPYAYVDLTACPLSGPALANFSRCSAYNADNARASSTDLTNPAVYYTNQHEVADVVTFDRRCAASPDDTLATVLVSEGIQIQPADDADTDNADLVSP